MLILAGPTGEREHEGHAFHPERPARITAVMAGINDLRLDRELVSVGAPLAARADLARVHSEPYLDELEGFCSRGGGDLDPDTFAGPDSWEAARRAAGAGLAAIATLGELDDGVAFVVARPPGHHAERDRAMGFCLLNNVAVSAAALAARGERVLIVDWDVHHGNGTQAVFWDDPNVLYVSTHQWPLFPGTGRALELGGPNAAGLIVNVPVPPGATGDVVLLAIRHVAGPTIERFAPQWVLVSCGFDAHRDDPLGELALSSGDFAELARLVSELAPGPGRLALFLEGGYDLQALRTSVAATLAVLLGGDKQPGEPPTSGGPGLDLVYATRRARDREVVREGPGGVNERREERSR
jgi:acetoin utilization deacetylase AcuC-like enzyme